MTSELIARYFFPIYEKYSSIIIVSYTRILRHSPASHLLDREAHFNRGILNRSECMNLYCPVKHVESGSKVSRPIFQDADR